jgi:hypothetical protein
LTPSLGVDEWESERLTECKGWARPGVYRPVRISLAGVAVTCPQSQFPVHWVRSDSGLVGGVSLDASPARLSGQRS